MPAVGVGIAASRAASSAYLPGVIAPSALNSPPNPNMYELYVPLPAPIIRLAVDFGKSSVISASAASSVIINAVTFPSAETASYADIFQPPTISPAKTEVGVVVEPLTERKSV